MMKSLGRWVSADDRSAVISIDGDAPAGRYSIKHFSLKDGEMTEEIFPMVREGNLLRYKIKTDEFFIDRFQIFIDGKLYIEFFSDERSGTGSVRANPQLYDDNGYPKYGNYGGVSTPGQGTIEKHPFETEQFEDIVINSYRINGYRGKVSKFVSPFVVFSEKVEADDKARIFKNTFTPSQITREAFDEMVNSGKISEDQNLNTYIIEEESLIIRIYLNLVGELFIKEYDASEFYSFKSIGTHEEPPYGYIGRLEEKKRELIKEFYEPDSVRESDYSFSIPSIKSDTYYTFDSYDILEDTYKFENYEYMDFIRERYLWQQFKH